MSTRCMRFIGVDTSPSSMMRLFPIWSDILHLDAELKGLDIPLGSPRKVFRQALTELLDDPTCIGALVTTHKISIFDAARDMFTTVDTFAAEVGEVSAITLRDGQAHGSAKDPITAGLALSEVIASNYFADGGTVLCLGAGGAGTAVCWHLCQRIDPPSHIVVADTDANRLAHLEQVVRPHAVGTQLRTVSVSGRRNADLLADMPPHSLVINATGMGKDRPGSPLPDEAVFPAESVVWEFNYRGSLEFLAQARAQQVSRGLTVVDGWRYFIHGWSQVVAEVFDIPMPAATVELLAQAAEATR